MGKKHKLASLAQTEGRAAAQAAQGRNTNPYPQSTPNDRDEWFKGFDEALSQQISKTK